MNEFISRSKAIVTDILKEIDRPDRNPVRLRELREELKLVAQSDINERKPMKGHIPVRITELWALLAVVMVFGLTIGWLCFKLSERNQIIREQSQTIYKLHRGQ